MSVSSNKTAAVKSEQKPGTGAPVVKDAWTVSGGDYTPQFNIKGALLISSGNTEADLKYKLRQDDTADVVTLATNVIHPIGDLISAEQTGTTATTVIFFG